MPLIHDIPVDAATISSEIQTNLYDAGLRWYSDTDIMNALQDAYNMIVALLGPIEHSSFIPQLSEPYYDLRYMLPDFMYTIGIFNPFTNQWLEGLSYKQMKATYQTYLAIGQPKWINVVDLSKVIVWPYLPGATGVLYVLYKSQAPLLSHSSVPILPYSVGGQLLENLTTSELFEQAREFKKAQRFLDKAFKPASKDGKSLYEQCKLEIQNLARTDREIVLEPYRWIFHGGQFSMATWINNETPSGTINGTNATFVLNGVPNPTDSVLLTKNGQVVYQNVAFTLSGQTITFNSGYIPQPADITIPSSSDDLLRAWYQIA